MRTDTHAASALVRTGTPLNTCCGVMTALKHGFTDFVKVPNHSSSSCLEQLSSLVTGSSPRV